MAQKQQQQSGRKKHVPQRTCIACRTKSAKRTYVRLVRTPELEVVVDRTGKANGRGAYLCPTRQCWYRALDGSDIEQALKVEVSKETKEMLREYARTHFPPEEGEETSTTISAAQLKNIRRSTNVRNTTRG